MNPHKGSHLSLLRRPRHGTPPPPMCPSQSALPPGVTALAQVSVLRFWTLCEWNIIYSLACPPPSLKGMLMRVTDIVAYRSGFFVSMGVRHFTVWTYQHTVRLTAYGWFPVRNCYVVCYWNICVHQLVHMRSHFLQPGVCVPSSSSNWWCQFTLRPIAWGSTCSVLAIGLPYSFPFWLPWFSLYFLDC